MLPRRILTCPRSQMTCPAGSRLGLAMSSRAVAAAKELFASICDISNFPTAGTSTCRLMLRIAGARSSGGARGGGQPENNFARRNRRRRPSVETTAPGGVPPSPQPLTHPARDPGPPFGAGVFLYGTIVENPPRELGHSLARACMCALPMRRWCRRRVGGPLPFGTKPGAFLCRLAAAPRAGFEAAKPAPPPDHPGAPSPRGRRTRGSRQCRRRGGL